MALNPQDYWQHAASLLAIGLYLFRYLKKSREDARELDGLKRVRQQQEIEDSTADMRLVAQDARSLSEMRAEVITEQARQIERLKRRAQAAEEEREAAKEERDECREQLGELRKRLERLENPA